MTESLRIRMGGLLCLMGALPVGWFFIMRPLQQARAGVPEIDFYGKGAFVLFPLLVLWGATFLIGGEKARYRDVSVHPPKPTALGWVLMLLSLVVAGLCLWWVDAQFSALGYRFL
jgi:hypothetical protein